MWYIGAYPAVGACLGHYGISNTIKVLIKFGTSQNMRVELQAKKAVKHGTAYCKLNNNEHTH